MRIVIDMQGAQSESRFRGIGRYSLSIVKSILQYNNSNEIMIALNGLFPETIEYIRSKLQGHILQENIKVWQAVGPVKEPVVHNAKKRKISKVLKKAFFKSLEPDMIFITSLFEGFGDDSLTSIDDIPTAVISYDLIPLLNPEHYLTHNKLYKQFYLNKIEELKIADFIFTISES